MAIYANVFHFKNVTYYNSKFDVWLALASIHNQPNFLSLVKATGVEPNKGDKLVKFVYLFLLRLHYFFS